MREFPLTYEAADGFVHLGNVTSVAAGCIGVRVPGVTPGDIVSIERRAGAALLAEVRATDAHSARCAPLGNVAGISAGAAVRSDLGRLGAYIGPALLGRIADAWGRAEGRAMRAIAPLDAPRVPLRSRAPIGAVLRTGIAAIDAFATLGHGQRVSLNAGAGVGKTTLLRRLVDSAEVDARVVALVGERGREAAESWQWLRGSPYRRSTSLYCATSDASAIERFTAARAATAQAEWLCQRGRRVLLVVDSLTRTAAAWRELALAAGESPAQRGHPPSLSAVLARLVERAGARHAGSITAVYTVLVDGDDQFEPVSDAIRALLDGHIALSRRLAEAARYPAIDVARSLSRVMPEIVAPKHRRDAALVRQALATLEEAQDLFAIGAYRRGEDAWLDACVGQREGIEALIHDGDGSGGADPIAMLGRIATELRRAPGRPDARA